MYDLLVAPPHEAPSTRYVGAEFAAYRDGYTWALVMALRVMESAARRHELYRRTKRLDAARRRKAARGK